jgi:hypothetical protein
MRVVHRIVVVDEFSPKQLLSLRRIAPVLYQICLTGWAP